MKRWIIRILAASLAVIVSLTIFVLLTPAEASKSVSLSFVKAEAADRGLPFAEVDMTLLVQNRGGKSAFLQVSAVETNAGDIWVADEAVHETGLYRTLGRVEGNQSEELSVVIPQGDSARRLKILVSEEASILQKARFGLLRYLANVRGGKNHTKFWFDNLMCPGYELTVEIKSAAEPLLSPGGQ